MPKLNKPAKEGYTYRSPDQTNAKSYLPHPEEDVMASQSADNARIKKGLDAPAERAYNRLQQQEAGGRAVTRSAGRAGAAGAALEFGYDLGRKIDENTGLGKTMVNKFGLGDLAEKMATPNEKVELTDESKARIARGDLNEKPNAPAYKDSEGGGGGRSELRDTTLMENREPKEDNMKHGGITRSKFSKRADGIAQRGHTKGRMR